MGWRARLAYLPAGPDLAVWLDRRPTALATVTSPVRPTIRGNASVSDDFGRYGKVWANTLIESMQARQRVIAHLQAEQLADIADLSRAYPGLYEELPAEIGMATRVHEVAAGRQLELARRLTTDLTATWHALSVGAITIEAATAIHEATETSDATIATRVEAVVLQSAPDLTPRRIRRRCRELVARFDPANVKERHRKAAADRTITRQLAADGMVSLTMWAPAQQVAVVWHTLTTVAKQAKTPGDGKTIGNRRCDALTDICHELLATGGVTLAGCPSTIDALGSIPAPNEAEGGSRTVCEAEGGSRTVCEVDDLGQPSSSESIAAVHAKSVRRQPISMINVTVPHTVLLGSDDACNITGFGTITADQARELLAHDARLRRLLLDPTTRQVLDVGRTTYRPPTHIADHVRARDTTCGAPSCDNPATDCDLDHLQPFKTGEPHGGDTSTTNLIPLCRHHHRSKDFGGSTVHRTPHGYRWTTPLGRSYLNTPPTLYEPGDSDGPLSGPGNGYISLWARPHQQANGSIAYRDNPTGPPNVGLASTGSISESENTEKEPPF